MAMLNKHQKEIKKRTNNVNINENEIVTEGNNKKTFLFVCNKFQRENLFSI